MRTYHLPVRQFVWLLVCLLAAPAALWWAPTAQATAIPLVEQPSQLFLPLLTAATVDSQHTVGGMADDRWASCSLNAQELAIAERMAAHPEQGRPTLTCNPILARVARARAADMAARAYFDHITPEGDGPNHLVVKAGYPLPAGYLLSRDANMVESIGGGYETPEAVWQAWLDSHGHREHLLAGNDAYVAQEQIGIGYVADPASPYGYYWVVITAPNPD
jgi:uncharacterized protein YkwD